MFFLRVKQMLTSIVALTFCLFACISMRACNTIKLCDMQGDRIFYLQSASSQGLRKENLSIQDLFSIKGECVRLEKAVSVEEILSYYRAEVLFIERVCGVTSYYCHTKAWSDVLYLQGYSVNLHVAIAAEQTVVGTPIIFDGY